MRADAALLFCDGDDSLCGAWDLDYYAQTATTVGDVRITLQERAPGWTSVGDEDFCPEHKPTTKDESDHADLRSP